MSPPPQSILITGGTGFLGRAIVLQLSAAHPDWSLHIFDIQPPSASDTQLLSVPNTTFTVGDILSRPALDSALTTYKPTAVIHTAGIVTPLTQRYGKGMRETVWRVNVEGTRNVLAASREASWEVKGEVKGKGEAAGGGVRAFVWTGSCCAVIDDFRYQYPNVDETWATSPTGENTIYGESKAVAEEEVLAANRRLNGSGGKGKGKGGKGEKEEKDFLTCSLRPCTLFGDTDSQLLSGIHGLIASGETPFVIGDALNLWDVCHAANVADAHVLAVENLLTGNKAAAGEAFFIGNEEPIPFRTFCCAVWREFGHVPSFELNIPTGLAWFVGLVAEGVSFLLGRDPGLRRASVADATATRYADGRKARRILGYEAKIPLHEGITRSCRLYRERLENKAALEAQKGKGGK